MEVAAMATHLNTIARSYRSKTTMEVRWINQRSKLKSSRIPIFISTNPSLVNPQTLKDLYRKCNHSCYRFPVDRNGDKLLEEAVDLKKLRVALSHSSILVSVFCNLRDEERGDEEGNGGSRGFGDLVRTMMPLPMVSPSDGELVGFGRAVSDFGLTAAIYDVMVIPSLQRMGIGKMIVNRMIRMLTSRDIYDISALCSINESLFFKACGFGDDVLGSTTMMYTRTASTYSEGEQMVKQVGTVLNAEDAISATGAGTTFLMRISGTVKTCPSSGIIDVAQDGEVLYVSGAMTLTEIAIPRLEELKVEWNSLKDKLNDNNQPEFLSKLKVIELTGFRCEYAILPSNFLQNFPKLEKLALSDDLIEEINLHELSFHNDKDPESLALLTKLKLSNLPKLKHVVHEDSHLVPPFQNLEDLEVIERSRLKILVPSSVSFQNLTNLQVSKCDGLMSLITASTARSLVQLKKMVVKEYKMMQEILAIAPDGLEYEIRFSQLECLELDDLPCLESFCLGNYDFYFPSLEEVVVTGCPNMNDFARSVTPKLKKVKTGRHEYDWEWEGSLSNTIRALYIEKDGEETNARNT